MEVLKIASTPSLPQTPFGESVLGEETCSPVTIEPPFRGDSSFDIQTTQASFAAELSAHAAGANSQIGTALKSLKALIEGQKAPSRVDDLHFDKKDNDHSFPAGELPPAALVIALLKKVKGMELDTILQGNSRYCSNTKPNQRNHRWYSLSSP